LRELLTPAFTKASGDHREPRHEGILGDQFTNGYAGINKNRDQSGGCRAGVVWIAVFDIVILPKVIKTRVLPEGPR
jgi:hypothetical protein